MEPTTELNKPRGFSGTVLSHPSSEEGPTISPVRSGDMGGIRMRKEIIALASVLLMLVVGATFIDSSSESDADVTGSTDTPPSGQSQIIIGSDGYSTFSEAIAALTSSSGDVVIIINGSVDISNMFNTNGTIKTGLTSLINSSITKLTIQGENRGSFTTGFDGNGIDGPTYCPCINLVLPGNCELSIKDITFTDDLWFDATNNHVKYEGCTFNGSISGYPESNMMTFERNTFDFQGTADNFYSGNAYPVWFKITTSRSEDSRTFTLEFHNNLVKGCRGVHLENRQSGSSNVYVTGNTFELDGPDEYKNKLTALQVVNLLSGNIMFTDNTVNAYMAVCLFSGASLTGSLEYSRNTESDGCKTIGISEWNANGATVDSILKAQIGSKYYGSLSYALEKAENGDVVKLLSDTSEVQDIRDGIILDLNGHEAENIVADKIVDTSKTVTETLEGTDSASMDSVVGGSYDLTFNLSYGKIVVNGTATGTTIQASIMPISSTLRDVSMYEVIVSGIETAGSAITISLAYSIPDNARLTSISVDYYPDSGSKEAMTIVDYTDDLVTFTTTHNSDYGVATTYETTITDDDDELPFIPGQNVPQTSSGSDDKTTLVAAAAAVVVIMLAVVALMAKKN